MQVLQFKEGAQKASARSQSGSLSSIGFIHPCRKAEPEQQISGLPQLEHDLPEIASKLNLGGSAASSCPAMMASQSVFLGTRPATRSPLPIGRAGHGASSRESACQIAEPVFCVATVFDTPALDVSRGCHALLEGAAGLGRRTCPLSCKRSALLESH